MPVARLLTVDEAAAELGVPSSSLRNAARHHGLLVRIGRHVRVDPDDLPELIDRCRDQPRDRDSTAAPTAGTTLSGTEIDSCALAHETAEKLKRHSRGTSPKRASSPARVRRIK